MRSHTQLSVALFSSASIVMGLIASACSSDSGGHNGTAGASSGSAGFSGSADPAGGSNDSGGSGEALAGGAGGSTTASGGNTAAATLPGEIPIVTATSGDAPYQFGSNPYLIQGGAFFAKSMLGPGTAAVALDKTQSGKVCLKGTVDMVPTPEDGSHPPYSQYWGLALGFNLNQGAEVTPVKAAWPVPSNVIGFWFTVTGATIPPLRFKTTPTGKLPALEQDSCALVSPVSGVPNQVLFKDMIVQCWNGTGAATDLSKGLEDISIQVAAATDAAYPVDFCLTAIGVVTM